MSWISRTWKWIGGDVKRVAIHLARDEWHALKQEAVRRGLSVEDLAREIVADFKKKLS